MRAAHIPRLAVPLLVACLVAGCAQTAKVPRNTGQASLQCPAGHTMTCEANTIGRIRHGSFGKSERCACMPDGMPTLESPAIPTTH